MQNFNGRVLYSDNKGLYFWHLDITQADPKKGYITIWLQPYGD